MKFEESSSNEPRLETIIQGELAELKADIYREISNLKRRITSLEKENWETHGKGKLIKESFCGETESRFIEKSCYFPCVPGNRLTYLSVLQTIWLFICLVLVIYVGITKFIVAHINETSPWKPDKKAYTIDYLAGGDTDVNYENPSTFLLLHLVTSEGKWWTSEMMNATLIELQELQYWCWTLLKYENTSGYNYIQCPDVEVFDAGSFEDLFYAGVFLEFSDPDPTQGAYSLYLTITMGVLTLLEHVEKIFNIAFAVHRDLAIQDWENADWQFLSVDLGAVSWFIVYWGESVLHKMDGSTETTVISAINGDATLEGPLAKTSARGTVTFQLVPDFIVDHYEEYLSYGYIDWIMAMGGLISIGMTAFVMIASFIPRGFNNSASIGILPRFSLAYKNTEAIIGVKELLKPYLEEPSNTKFSCTTDKKTFLQPKTTFNDEATSIESSNSSVFEKGLYVFL